MLEIGAGGVSISPSVSVFSCISSFLRLSVSFLYGLVPRVFSEQSLIVCVNAWFGKTY